MTKDEKDRMAELSNKPFQGGFTPEEKVEWDELLFKWKNEIKNEFDLRKLKPGDIVKCDYSDLQYIVLQNSDRGPVVANIFQIKDPKGWSKAV